MSGLSLASQTPAPPPDTPMPGEWTALKRRLHAQFVADADASRLARLSPAALAEQVGALAARLLLEDDLALTGRQRAGLVQAVLHELVGLGPLEPLLQDATVSEIMVNGASQVYVERRGRLTRTEVAFDDDAHLRRIIERIVSPLGRRVDESSPMVDARLPDGTRVPIRTFC